LVKRDSVDQTIVDRMLQELGYFDIDQIMTDKLLEVAA
jgi:hypothetical protein